MAERIPDNVLDLFQKPVLANVATVMPDGTPQVTPVWVDFDGSHILVNTVKGRRKVLNMQERPKVGLDMVDTENPFHWLSVRGHVVEITEAGANDHIDKLAKNMLVKINIHFISQEKYESSAKFSLSVSSPPESDPLPVPTLTCCQFVQRKTGLSFYTIDQFFAYNNVKISIY